MFRAQLGTENLTIPYLALSGAIAGTCQVVATNPMEIVKIRMQMSASHGGNVTYGSIIRDLGISGLYTGMHATLLRYGFSERRMAYLCFSPIISTWIPSSTAPSMQLFFLTEFYPCFLFHAFYCPLIVMSPSPSCTSDPTATFARSCKMRMVTCRPSTRPSQV